MSPRIRACFRSAPVVYFDTDKGNRSVCQKMGTYRAVTPIGPVVWQAVKARLCCASYSRVVLTLALRLPCPANRCPMLSVMSTSPSGFTLVLVRR